MSVGKPTLILHAQQLRYNTNSKVGTPRNNGADEHSSDGFVRQQGRQSSPSCSDDFSVNFDNCTKFVLFEEGVEPRGPVQARGLLVEFDGSGVIGGVGEGGVWRGGGGWRREWGPFVDGHCDIEVGDET